VDLFRVFQWDGVSLDVASGGPLFVPRARQGQGRHDCPTLYGAWYCTRHPLSAVAEAIQHLRGRRLADEHFWRGRDSRQALVALRLSESVPLVDLDDAAQLLARRLQPSHVATHRRSRTQRIAESIFSEGAAGIRWWSTLNAEWTNVTLFHERALPQIALLSPPRPLSVELPEVREAAAQIGVHIRAES
jgi:hypothetical protein